MERKLNKLEKALTVSALLGVLTIGASLFVRDSKVLKYMTGIGIVAYGAAYICNRSQYVKNRRDS